MRRKHVAIMSAPQNQHDNRKQTSRENGPDRQAREHYHMREREE